MESKITIEPTIEEARFLALTESEKATLEMFRDPLCGSIVNPSDEKSRPLECTKCGQIFCLKCANDLFYKRDNCPSCNAPLSPAKVHIKLMMIFESLPVTCRYKSGGCDFSSKLSEIGRHEESCTYVNDQLAQYYNQAKFELTIKPSTEICLPYKVIMDRFGCGCGSQNTLKIAYDLESLPMIERLGILPYADELCKICSVNKKMTKFGTLRCSKCDLEICEDCAARIAQAPEQYSCSKGHLLRLNFTDPLSLGNTVECRICTFGLSYQKGVFSCNVCRWDMCRECNFAPLKCKNNHQLYRVKDFRHYDKALYKKNMFDCDICRCVFQNEGKGTLHCAKCHFDICNHCMIANRADLQIYCPKKHKLYPAYDLRKFSRDDTSLYAKNKYNCDGCQKNLSNDVIPVLHCASCEYDLCGNCVKK